jgi:hypothetical protein
MERAAPSARLGVQIEELVGDELAGKVSGRRPRRHCQMRRQGRSRVHPAERGSPASPGWVRPGPPTTRLWSVEMANDHDHQRFQEQPIRGALRPSESTPLSRPAWADDRPAEGVGPDASPAVSSGRLRVEGVATPTFLSGSPGIAPWHNAGLTWPSFCCASAAGGRAT